MSLPVYIVITPFFPSPASWRGAYCYDFVCALKQTGKFDVRVLVPGNGEDYIYRGVQVYRFPVYELPSALLPFLFSLWNRKSFLKKISSLGFDLKQVKVCHAHTAFFGIYPLAIKKLNPDCLSLLHHHDLASFGLNLGRLRHFYPHKLINFLLLRRLHKKIDCHVFISQASRKSFLAVPDASWCYYDEYKRQMKGLGLFAKLKIKNSIILHNGVDCQTFAPCKKQDHGFTIGCIGNFGEMKSQITLLKAAVLLRNEFPELKLRFIGSGEKLAECKKYVRDQHLENIVSFESECEHHLLPEFYHNVDLFVLPSFFEGFGCVFAEAAACGIPFMTCEGQGIEDLILPEEREIWLFPPKNADALAEKIRFYFSVRPTQHLTDEIEINKLVSVFVEELSSLKN